MQSLLEHGALVDAKNCNGHTPLIWAMLNFRPDNQADMQLIVDALIAANADLSIAGSDSATPLHLATCGGHPSLVQSLLEHGALVDAKNCNGHTPLIWAMLNFRPDNQADMQLIVDALIAANADLNAVDDKGGSNSLMLALVITSGSEDSKMYTPAAVCIALIEAGENHNSYRMHFLEPCAADRCRPLDYGL